jgi:putative transposase
MLKTFKYRLYPTRKQTQAIEEMLETHRRIFNNALAQRKSAWEESQESISYGDQSAVYKEQRKTNKYYQRTNFSSCQRTLRRLDKAFKAFFRRVQAGEKPGYPRFKWRSRWKSVEFTYGDGSKIRDNGKLYIQHIGELKVKWHRRIKGEVKTVTIKRRADRYYACFSCEAVASDRRQLEPTGAVVGLDMGVSNFVTTSDGEFFEPPKYLRQSERKLRQQQRRAARRQKGSNRRRKAIRNLQRTHEHIANQRKDTAHKVARQLVEDYDLIAVENLNTNGLLKNHHLAKSIADAAWNTFITILTSKAEEAGRRLIKVDPKYTSQECSQCGAIVKKDLSVRIHSCPHCGLVLDRDVNAAMNILQKALARTGLSGANVEVANSCVS